MYHQALIFGASGISGWAVTRAAVLSKPPFAFDKVIGLTNRTLSIKDSSLPEDPRLELKSGLDLSLGVSAVVDVLRTINGIENTTHVYFTAYIHGAFGETNSDARTRINVEILRNAVLAVETLSPALRFWTLQSGAKWYGTEFSHILKPKTPFKGTDPRIPSPYADHCFYYPQEGLLQNLSQGKGWDFANIIPDSIIGFVPNGNPMTIAHPIGLYLALWKSFGGSKEVAFPGTPTSYRTLHADSAQDLLGDFTIFLSMQGDKVAGQSFNIADNDSVTWQSTWPGICSYFGLHGTDPVEDSALPQGEKWVMDLKPQWEQWERQHSLKKGTVANAPWDFFTLIV
ncbi:uncharacterized protein A1O9_02520 [Exophiala aquamarina CBS 119918]|uniref:PRISE-like Rossmann-fold domain-containing protein n=1 Tax=Exophiala aquamarina CBS 119918 TaxID=1182545 RepID=A0A072PM47_9EURO|nr:uncharacterized protein A1O9_02520 [Exophiala aquamarina CBS 119918]KEF60956.1 hypothetical protein A1O9_02520 [Exophiala aquamarina CBS 119918]